MSLDKNTFADCTFYLDQQKKEFFENILFYNRNQTITKKNNKNMKQTSCETKKNKFTKSFTR